MNPSDPAATAVSRLPHPRIGPLPVGFLWGAATSAHQIEGNNVNSDAWALEHAATSPFVEPSLDACDSYERWPEDVALVEELGFNAYRFSLEWARIEPEPGVVSSAQLDHYRRMIESCRDRGIAPVVTLHHFTNPRWFRQAGGWRSGDAVDRFVRYVAAVAPILEGVEWVVTINEPNVIALIERGRDPGRPEGGDRHLPDEAVGEVLVAAHRQACSILHAATSARVGWSVATQAFGCRSGAEGVFDEWNRLWEDLYLRPAVDDDFLGVQAYTSRVIGPDGPEPVAADEPTSLTGWALRPDALGAGLRRAWELTGGTPLVVTENGLATEDDSLRIRHTAEALTSMRAAMDDGVDVRGYLHWSLLDNFEWAAGYRPTFGLVAVDRGDFRRAVKPSGRWLGALGGSPGHPRPGLSLEQKVSLTSGSGTWTTGAVDGIVPGLRLSDGPHGLRTVPADAATFGGRPLPATCFPPAVGLGSSWNGDLVRRVAEAIGREAAAAGVHVVLGPGLNIKRSPLGGRNFEYVSEDPLVASQFGISFVEGVQSTGVGTAVKHFAVNNQETDRMRVNAVVDEQTLRELYLAAFEPVIREARPTTVMTAYNRINGVYASEDPWLLTTVLCDEWGFDGLVLSDWGAVDSRVDAVRAGLDLEMPPTGTDGEIERAVRQGTLDEAVLDRVVARTVHLAGRVAGRTPGAAVDLVAHDALALEAARESIVLLKNDGDLLPLDPGAGSLIAVVGELARSPRIQGGGSSRVTPRSVVDPLGSIAAALTGASAVEFAPGYLLAGAAPGASPTAEHLVDEAAELAARADVVLCFLGLPSPEESEGRDRETIDLPVEQTELLDRVLGTCADVVVVLSNGGVIGVHPWSERVPAVVESWLLGQASGQAIADVLFGRCAPSGRLTETIPLRLSDTPCARSFPGTDGTAVYGEGRYVGYRYYDSVGAEVSYPFGHGLTYTAFDYRDLVVTPTGPDQWSARCTVTNSGPRDGDEVVQLYVAVDEARPTRPVHELRAFAKVHLAAGSSSAVTFDLGPRDLAVWDGRRGGWRVPAGRYVVEIGASSRDIRLRADLLAAGDTALIDLTASSTVGEWLDHPIGRTVLDEVLASAGAGVDRWSPTVLGMLAHTPLIKLRTFELGLDPDRIDEMVALVKARTAGTAATDGAGS